ncbi:unnamed protein product [Rotaria magnacalcarata]|uniref:Uncharacterized protein n=1 Tax=Rotaria magnacalcarata TaxID=392030 RepID=A0A814ULV0_9BILA|nr:unnamed protein product [Rotaria magnacalcarata]
MCSLNFKFRFVLHMDDIELQDALELAKTNLIVLNFYLPGRQNDNANFIEVLSYTSSREECRRIWQKKEEAQNSTNFDENRKSNHVNGIDISAYREPGTSQTQEDVMHKDINLLLVRGKSAGDYAWW